MRWFVNLSLLKKIMLISIVMMGCAVCWGAFNSYLGYLLQSNEVKARNKALVESMVSVMENLQLDVENGELTKEEAQDTAKKIIRSSRYDGKQYFFMTSLDGQAIVHPLIPDLEKQDLSKTNPKSYERYLNFGKIAQANKDGGVSDYEGSKPGQPKDVMYPKSSYVKLIPQWGWVIGTGVYMDDVANNALKNFYLELGFVSLFGVVMAIGTYGAVRLLSRPLLTISANMGRLASGDTNITVTYDDRNDEVGHIAKAFKVFKENAIEKIQLEREQEALKIKTEQDKKQMMEQLAQDFESQISGILKELSVMSGDMSKKASHMLKASRMNVETSHVVSRAASGADQNVQVVAGAAEELAASSTEIAKQISSVAEKSGRASSQARNTSQSVQELNQLADSIGDVVNSIKEIAEQTNLLALNATIEAARAGEAGKGFAVVADEVKKLATETAEKTMQIDERVGKIQNAIRISSEAMGIIIQDVQDIDHATSTVASAVEEQNAATSEIGRNVAEASVSTREVAENISQVLHNAEETGTTATDVEIASRKVEESTKHLSDSVSNFLTKISQG